ncbi:hypothetical protein QA596_02445 [Balneolales bacterium ANBcel1]|nr:hypothetical protein [Balneolales bacterium ANBcel1]
MPEKDTILSNRRPEWAFLKIKAYGHVNNGTSCGITIRAVPKVSIPSKKYRAEKKSEEKKGFEGGWGGFRVLKVFLI